MKIDGAPGDVHFARKGSAYAHPRYASSLAEFGDPLQLRESGGWLLRRRIPGTDARDATGCYPVFACEDWSNLGADLAALEGLASLVAVIDPLAGTSVAELERHFDEVRFFKTHYLVDLTEPVERIASRHHRRCARRALRQIEIETHFGPSVLDDWISLYQVLVERKGLHDISAFSPRAFATQLTVPGTVVLLARIDGRAVGADWYFVDGSVAYGHLAAFSPEGYGASASYALQWRALEILADHGVKCLDLGGAPGLSQSPTDGLALFKDGWATHTAPAYLATRVLDPALYGWLSRGLSEDVAYFPAYRAVLPA